MPASTNDIDWQSFEMAHGSNSTEEDAGQWVKYRKGLTKREHFAAMALQGLLSKNMPSVSMHQKSEIAVKYADALLYELDN